MQALAPIRNHHVGSNREREARAAKVRTKDGGILFGNVANTRSVGGSIQEQPFLVVLATVTEGGLSL